MSKKNRITGDARKIRTDQNKKRRLMARLRKANSPGALRRAEDRQHAKADRRAKWLASFEKPKAIAPQPEPVEVTT